MCYNKFMRKILAVSILSIFIGIAVFGFFRMDMSHGHNNCIASIMNPNALCPDADSLAMSAFHVETFRNFLSATFGGGMSMLLLMFLFTVVVGLAFLGRTLATKQLSLLQKPLYPCPQRSSHRINFDNWFSIHENSPSFVI